ncbi:MAG: PIN domain-containing protein [Spirochaetaceae bacterium]|jgi:predicted nucleic acid-binding protein|nr:PIN domain-containing protein [Spirochaetaceae bacterium]
MQKLTVYLDNCCYNRPYDDQSQAKVVLETLAKLYIQELVLNRKLDLVWSYILKFENSQNSFEAKREAIAQWEKLSVRFVGKSDEVVALAKEVEETGVKPPDALHIACAITAKCDYLISVDNRVLKYRDDRITVCNPVDFVQREAGNDE